MIKESHLEIVRSRGPKIGRILVGFAFFVFGASMLMSGPEGSVKFYEAVGVPMASIAVWVVAILKLVAGIALMLGKYVPEAAAALIVFVLIATLLAHLDFADSMQLTQAMKNLAIVGGLLFLMAYGPGGTDITNDGIRD